jgi:hypothetical protein
MMPMPDFVVCLCLMYNFALSTLQVPVCVCLTSACVRCPRLCARQHHDFEGIKGNETTTPVHDNFMIAVLPWPSAASCIQNIQRRTARAVQEKQQVHRLAAPNISNLTHYILLWRPQSLLLQCETAFIRAKLHSRKANLRSALQCNAASFVQCCTQRKRTCVQPCAAALFFHSAT